MNLTSQPISKHLKFILGEEVIGEWGYWFEEWNVTYSENGMPSCGAFTLLDPLKIPLWSQGALGYGYACRAVVHSKASLYGGYEQKDYYFVISGD